MAAINDIKVAEISSTHVAAIISSTHVAAISSNHVAAIFITHVAAINREDGISLRGNNRNESQSSSDVTAVDEILRTSKASANSLSAAGHADARSTSP